MKTLSIILISLILFSISCRTNAETYLVEKTNKTPVIKDKTSLIPTPESKKIDINSKIGNVEIGNKCVRLFTENKNLRVGDKVQIILPENSSQKISEAEVIENLECKDEHFGDLVPDNHEAKLTEYLLKLSDKNDTNSGFGIGIVNTDNKVKLVNGLAIIDLNDDKKNEYFRECTSNEGLHLTVWTGKPLKGKRIWHSYYHFNYDTEPNCKKKDYEETDN